MKAEMIGRVRKLYEGIDKSSVSDNEQITLTPQLEQLVAPSAAPFREITRMGRAFAVTNTTAVAAVVALPTTAVHLALYNNAPDGGRSLVIDWVAATNVVSTAVATQAQLLFNIGQVRETAPTDAGLVISKMNGNGGGTNDTFARTIVSGTALPATTGAAGRWYPIGTNATKPGVAATPGYGLWAPIDGRIIVAPGRYFAVSVLASVVGETFLTSIGWHELWVDLG